MRIPVIPVTAAIVCMCRPAFAATSGVVFIDYYDSSGCAHCETAKEHMAGIASRYAPSVTVLHHGLSTPEDWRPLLEREQVLGNEVGGPPAVYVGTNALYGVEAVVAGLEPLVVSGIVAGGVAPWQPPANEQPRIAPQPPAAVSAGVQRAGVGGNGQKRALRAAVRAGLAVALALAAVILVVWYIVRPRG